MIQRTIDLETIEADVDRIRSLGLDALRARWRSMFGATLPAALTKDMIARMMTYRMQEEAIGGLDCTTVKLLTGLARGEKPGAEIKRRLKAGTVLVREYQGERHTVTVVPDGYVWRATTYGSLSTIARAITGTAWGGPRFFGLRTARGRQEGENKESNEPGTKPTCVARVGGTHDRPKNRNGEVRT